MVLVGLRWVFFWCVILDGYWQFSVVLGELGGSWWFFGFHGGSGRFLMALGG